MISDCIHSLNDLVQLKQAGDETALNARLEELLAARPKRRAALDGGYKTAEQSLDDALKGCGLVRQLNGNVVPNLRVREESEKHRTRRLSRRQLERVEARLAAVGPERLPRVTLGGDAFHRFVLALLGKAPRSEMWSIVDRFAMPSDDDLE